MDVPSSSNTTSNNIHHNHLIKACHTIDELTRIRFEMIEKEAVHFDDIARLDLAKENPKVCSFSSP